MIVEIRKIVISLRNKKFYKDSICYMQYAEKQIIMLIAMLIFIGIVMPSSEGMASKYSVILQNILYSLIAAQIFYIITIGIPDYVNKKKYSCCILLTLNKISSIIIFYSNYAADDCDKEKIDCLYSKKIRESNGKECEILNRPLFKMQCNELKHFNTCVRIDNVDGFCKRIKNQFLHHFCELSCMFNYIDGDVLSILFELRNNLDKLNNLCFETTDDKKKKELCHILSDCAEINARMKTLIDKKYFAIVYNLSD